MDLQHLQQRLQQESERLSSLEEYHEAVKNYNAEFGEIIRRRWMDFSSEERIELINDCSTESIPKYRQGEMKNGRIVLLPSLVAFPEVNLQDLGGNPSTFLKIFDENVQTSFDELSYKDRLYVHQQLTLRGEKNYDRDKVILIEPKEYRYQQIERTPGSPEWSETILTGLRKLYIMCPNYYQVFNIRQTFRHQFIYILSVNILLTSADLGEFEGVSQSLSELRLQSDVLLSPDIKQKYESMVQEIKNVPRNSRLLFKEISFPVIEKTPLECLLAAKSLSIVQKYHYEMQYDEWMRTRDAFVESIAIGDGPLEPHYLAAEPLVNTIFNDELKQKLDDSKRVDCLDSVVRAVCANFHHRTLWTMYGTTLNELLKNSESVFTNTGSVDAIFNLISNAAWTILFLRNQYNSLLVGYLRMFELTRSEIQFSPDAIEKGYCLTILMQKLGRKEQLFDFLHMRKILHDLKVAYQQFPEQRELIPVYMMDYVDCFLEHYEMLTLLVTVGKAISEQRTIKAIKKYSLVGDLSERRPVSIAERIMRLDVKAFELSKRAIDSKSFPTLVREMNESQFFKFKSVFGDLKTKYFDQMWKEWQAPLFKSGAVEDALPQYQSRLSQHKKGLKRRELEEREAIFIDPASIWELRSPDAPIERYEPPKIRKKIKTTGLSTITVESDELIEMEGPSDPISTRPFFKLSPTDLETAAILFNRSKGVLKWSRLISLLTHINFSVAPCGGSRFKVTDECLQRSARLHAPHPDDECHTAQKNGYRSTLEDYFRITYGYLVGSLPDS
jgi:hypothetical protein